MTHDIDVAGKQATGLPAPHFGFETVDDVIAMANGTVFDPAACFQPIASDKAGYLRSASKPSENLYHFTGSSRFPSRQFIEVCTAMIWRYSQLDTILDTMKRSIGDRICRNTLRRNW